MTLPTFDPCSTVLLEDTTALKNSGTPKATVKVLNWRSNSSTHLVITDKPGFVVFSEPFTNGWLWKVDEWNVKPVRANYAFSAIAVPEGKHYIHRVYRPVSVVVGTAVSLIFLLGFVIFSVVRKSITSTTEKIAAPLNPGETTFNSTV